MGFGGGCWCVYFHPKPPDHERGSAANKRFKEKLVQDGRTLAALVFREGQCVAWCQFGSPNELPNIYHKKEVLAKTTLPDWRITCLFVDKDHRKKGLSAVALRGALELIKQLGGGVVESYPQDTQGENLSSSFLYNGTRQLFEKNGFKYAGSKGKNHCIMRIEV
jgi:GNAT superfamily N-acetyltransferase